jgi:hypothetical protein
LFDAPIRRAEMKSVAWAEAAAAAENCNDRLPLIGAPALGLGVVPLIVLAALWSLWPGPGWLARQPPRVTQGGGSQPSSRRPKLALRPI